MRVPWRADTGATTPEEITAGPPNGRRVVRADAELLHEVRATDIEPYTGLRYLSKLFRLMAIILLLLLVAEIVTGLVAQGASAIPTLLGETSRLVVLAGVLWGTGDLALLLIDMGHDVRASRILLARWARGGPVGSTMHDVVPERRGTAAVVDVSPGPPPPIP